MLYSLLFSLSLAAPLKTLDVPVDQRSVSVPVAAQQRYLSRAVTEAVSQLEFGSLTGHTLRLTVAGVLQMSEDALGGYLRQELVSHTALAGGRVDDRGEEQLVVRVGEAGIDRVLESREVRISRKKGWPIVMMSAGTGLALLGIGATAAEPYYGGTYLPVAAVGGLVAGGGVGLMFLPPKRTTVTCEVYRARVSIAVTFVGAAGKSWKTEGASDILVEEGGLPCEGEAEEARERR